MSNISFGTVLKDLTLLQPNIESEVVDVILKAITFFLTNKTIFCIT